MSSSKFAGLEGVEFDSPDVYETSPPSPTRRKRTLAGGRARTYGSSDEDDGDSEDDGSVGDGASTNRKNKKFGQGIQLGADGGSRPEAGEIDIVKSHINADEAARRFRDATEIDGKDVDFTSAIHRRRKKDKQMYYPRAGATFETRTYLLGSGSGYRTNNDDGEGEDDEDPWRNVTGTESALDKFRRLRFEAEELEKDLRQNGGGEGRKPVENAGEEALELLPQLQLLRQQLALLQEGPGLAGSAPTGNAAHWQAEAQKILGKLDRPAGEGVAAKVEGGSEAAIEDGASSRDPRRIVSLEQRLTGLESLVGIQDALQDESKALPRPLLPSLSRIEHLLTLLTQPRHLDGISRRIKVLVSELERAHEARRKLTTTTTGADDAEAKEAEANGTGPLSKETLARLDTVLPQLSKVEMMLPIVPALLSRLQSLSSLHASSASIASDVEVLEGVLRTSGTQSQELKDMLTNLERTMVENEARSKDNLTSVEKRMEKIVERMEKLSKAA